MILIWFYLLITILVIASGSLYALSFQESQLITMDQSRNNAFYLAEAGLDHKLQELRMGNQNPLSSISFGNGVYSASYNAATRQIVATGTANGISRTLIAVVARTTPPGARAAITALSDVALSGNITIDGRNHNGLGNLTGDPGTYGVSSNGTVTQGGSSQIGGNGFAPATPANPAAVEQNATANTYQTPEEVLGLRPGTLDQYRTSTPPVTPFHGIVYLTANLWNSPDFGEAEEPSTGILIVHNGTGTAVLKNVHGHFNGIIITDSLIHINGTAVINGAVVLQRQSGNNIGNGAAQVNYSSEILSNLPISNYSIVSWEDTQNKAYTYA